MTKPSSLVSAEALAAIDQIATRRDLSRWLASACCVAGAPHFLLVATMGDAGRQGERILASNWTYDLVHLVGLDHILALAEGAHAVAMGEQAASIQAVAEVMFSQSVSEVLAEHGLAAFCSLELRPGPRHYHLVLAAPAANAFRPERLGELQMMSAYVLSRLSKALSSAGSGEALSDRERECIHWVAQGKTTDEIAVILGLTSNTVNSYLVHAMQRCGARNRAMAVAAAIRSGAI
ncbi:helix-turn-helix transcriptional regulator [Mesorhizobium xinjiangense]|uniref:helix-turn-helix transcriptional regulator n=1 Tax=Mesorhizobium xinjiangense TaxID=2678685 RepID=UPI0018DE3F59|nr:helix-turn-helix transcriptional regulator [Mesorhizobium xinjiangense]